MQIPIEPVDAVTITTVMDNSSDMLLQDQGPAKRGGPGHDVPKRSARFLEAGETADALLAEHGFSALLAIQKGDTTARILFDAGMTPDGAAENLRRLELPVKDIEAIVLSHGHFDHTTGMHGIVESLGLGNLPVYIHPEFWHQRRIAIPGREPRDLPATSKHALLGAGFEIIEERQPSFLLDNSLLITGEVDRTTEFERGFPVHEAFINGEWQPDPLILDDQAAILHVRGKGLVVLTGCGHAGIVNIVRYAKRLTGIDQVYAVIGGFHLGGQHFEPIIGDTVAALRDLAPEVLVPAHCTGWKAQHALAAAMPAAFIPNSVGTRYEL